MHATQHLTIEGPRAGRGKSGFDTAARPVTRGAMVTATLRPSTSSPSMFATLRESSRTGGEGALMHASAVGGTTRRLQLAFERTRLHSRSLLRSRSEQMRSRAQAIVPKLHSKLQAASYQAGGQDWEGVYRFFDKNNDGALQYTELHSAVRRDLRFPPRGLPDDDIAMLFQLLDADGGGSVGLEELIGFLQDVNMVLSALNADPKRKFQNHKELLDAERKLDIAAREAREGALPWTPRLGGVVECEFRPDEWHLAQVSTKNYDPNTQAPTGRYTVRLTSVAHPKYARLCVSKYGKPTFPSLCMSTESFVTLLRWSKGHHGKRQNGGTPSSPSFQHGSRWYQRVALKWWSAAGPSIVRLKREHVRGSGTTLCTSPVGG